MGVLDVEHNSDNAGHHMPPLATHYTSAQK